VLFICQATFCQMSMRRNALAYLLSVVPNI
jgi:hypothetical protein